MKFQVVYDIDDYPEINHNKNSGIADWLLDNYKIFSIESTNELYVWNGIYYENNIKNQLLTLFESMYRLAGWSYQPNSGLNILRIISNRQAINGTKLNKCRDYIPFLNCWYDINKCIKVKPNPEIILTYCIPHNLNLKSECNLFKTTIKEIIPEDRDRNLLLKFMAYCLTPRVNLAKSLIMYGRGSNGKTVIMNVLKEIVGMQLHSLIPLQNLGDRFNKVVYMNKLVNIADDIPHKGLKNDSFIKEMITGKTLPGEIKGKQPFKYLNICKLISSCNQIPAPNERASDGFYRRWIIIPLVQVFDAYLDNEDIDLSEKLEKEVEGIIAYLISFIPSIMDIRKVNRSETKDKWMLYGESVGVFIKKCVNTDTASSIKKQWSYMLYKKWCNLDQLNIISETEFYKMMRNQGVMEVIKFDKKDIRVFHCQLEFTPDEIKGMGIEKTISGNWRFKKKEKEFKFTDFELENMEKEINEF